MKRTTLHRMGVTDWSAIVEEMVRCGVPRADGMLVLERAVVPILFYGGLQSCRDFSLYTRVNGQKWNRRFAIGIATLQVYRGSPEDHLVFDIARIAVVHAGPAIYCPWDRFWAAFYYRERVPPAELELWHEGMTVTPMVTGWVPIDPTTGALKRQRPLRKRVAP